MILPENRCQRKPLAVVQQQPFCSSNWKDDKKSELVIKVNLLNESEVQQTAVQTFNAGFELQLLELVSRQALMCMSERAKTYLATIISNSFPPLQMISLFPYALFLHEALV